METKDKLIEKQKELIKLLREQSSYQGEYTFGGLCKDIIALEKQVEEQEAKPVLTAEEMVNENFKGLGSLINDKDLCQWYKDLIKICLEEYTNQLKSNNQ